MPGYTRSVAASSTNESLLALLVSKPSVVSSSGQIVEKHSAERIALLNRARALYLICAKTPGNSDTGSKKV